MGCSKSKEIQKTETVKEEYNPIFDPKMYEDIDVPDDVIDVAVRMLTTRSISPMKRVTTPRFNENITEEQYNTIQFILSENIQELKALNQSKSIEKELYNGYTALMISAIMNLPRSLRYFLPKQVKLQDSSGKTALHYATIFMNHQIAVILAPYENNIKDNKNKTPIVYAVQNEDREMFDILFNSACKKNDKSTILIDLNQYVKISKLSTDFQSYYQEKVNL